MKTRLNFAFTIYIPDLDIKTSVTYKLTQSVTNLVYEAYSI